MDWKSGHEISPVIIRFEDGQGRAVLLNCSENLGDACASAFRQVQFLEKFADTTVPVTARHAMAGSEVVQIDGSIGAGIAGNGDAIRKNADFDGLPDFITTMIDGVDEGLLQGFIGVVEESLRFGFTSLLDHDLLDEDGIDIGKDLLDHAIQRAFEDLFSEDVASRSVRKLDDVDLGLRKKAGGIFIEKEQAHVEGFEYFTGSGDDVHLAAELGKVHSRCFI
jgi:hypothetical protein